MKKISRKENKEIKKLTEKYRGSMDRMANNHRKGKNFNASLGYLNMTTGGLFLLDPTGMSAAFYFGIAGMNFTIAKSAEKKQHNLRLMNEAGQFFTGREDIVHCLQAIDACMQEEAIYLELTLYTQEGRTGGKHINKMYELYNDAQKLTPYVTLESDMGPELLFEINCHDMMVDQNNSEYRPIYHTEFIDVFNQEAQKHQKAEEDAKQEAKRIGKAEAAKPKTHKLKR